MLFAALLKAHPGTVQERAARRVEWQHPEEIQVVAEYWLQTLDPAGIVVCKADRIDQLWSLTSAWDDLCDITVFPAIIAEDGLELLKER
jgi:hypothetical protein